MVAGASQSCVAPPSSDPSSFHAVLADTDSRVDVTEVATQIAKNCLRQPHHSHLRPRQQEPLRISAYTLYIQKLESLTYIFVAACMGLSLFQLVQWAPKDASFLHQSAFWPFKVVQGHPRSMILVPIESAYTTSY